MLLSQWRGNQNLPEAEKIEESVIEKATSLLAVMPEAAIKTESAAPETQNQNPQAAATPVSVPAPTETAALETQNQNYQATAAPVLAPVPVVTPSTVETPAPVETSDILESRLQATKNWLNQQPASTISIQLMGNSNDDQLRAGLKTLATQVELDNVYVFRTKVSNRPFVTVLYGSFPGREDAIQAMQKLPRALRANRPQLRTVGGILEETKQFQ